MSNSLLGKEDLDEINEYLRNQRTRRRQIRPHTLSFKMLDSDLGRLEVDSSARVTLAAHPYASILEIWSRDAQGDLLIASCILPLDDHGLVEQECQIDLPQKRINLHFKKDSEIEVVFDQFELINIYFSVKNYLAILPSRLSNYVKSLVPRKEIVFYYFARITGRFVYLTLIILVIFMIPVFYVMVDKEMDRREIARDVGKICSTNSSLFIKSVQASSGEPRDCFSGSFNNQSIDNLQSFFQDNQIDHKSKNELQGELNGLVRKLRGLNDDNPYYVRLSARLKLYLSYLTDINNELESAVMDLDKINDADKTMDDVLLKGYLVIKLTDNNEDNGNENEKAIDIFSLGLKKYPSAPDLQIGLANAYKYCTNDAQCSIQLPPDEEIEQLYKKAIDAKEKAKIIYWRDYDDLSEFYIYKNKYKEAVLESEKAVSLSVIAFIRQAELLVKLGCDEVVEKKYREFKSRLQELNSIKNLSMENAKSYSSIESDIDWWQSELYISNRQYDKAVTILSNYIQDVDAKDNAGDVFEQMQIRGKLGDAYYGMGMINKARAEYSMAVNPTNEMQGEQPANGGISEQWCSDKGGERLYERCVHEIEYRAKLFKVAPSLANKNSFLRVFDSAKDLASRRPDSFYTEYSFAAAIAFYVIQDYDQADQQLQIVTEKIESGRYSQSMTFKIHDPVLKEFKQRTVLQRLQKINEQLRAFCPQVKQ